MENIKISVSESGRDDSISQVRVDGVIDTLTATRLEEVLDRLLKRNRYHIILDLAGVDYISSAGWGIFISRIKEIRENKGDIKLANMVPNVYEIYELLEFDNILSAYESVHAAKTAFGAPAEADPVKKKDPIAGVRTVVKELPPGGDSFSTRREEVSRAEVAGFPIDRTEQLLLEAIRDDPFYTISELRLVLEESGHTSRISWWGIFRILRKHRLVSRRARFRYARQTRKRF